MLAKSTTLTSKRTLRAAILSAIALAHSHSLCLGGKILIRATPTSHTVRALATCSIGYCPRSVSYFLPLERSLSLAMLTSKLWRHFLCNCGSSSIGLSSLMNGNARSLAIVRHSQQNSSLSRTLTPLLQIRDLHQLIPPSGQPFDNRGPLKQHPPVAVPNWSWRSYGSRLRRNLARSSEKQRGRRIAAKKMLVIDEEGVNMGIMEKRFALQLAEGRGVELVLVSGGSWFVHTHLNLYQQSF